MARVRTMSKIMLSSGLVFLAFLSASHQAPVESERSAVMYLAQFGYMDPSIQNPNSGTLMSEDAFKKAVVDFQAFAGLEETGELDAETMKLMNTPRCGVKDKVGHGSEARKKRYALQGSRWRVKDLSYKISKYPNKVNREEVDREVERSFKVWSDHTDLNFTRKKTGQAHIEIRFEKGEHGDGDPFDGPGGTLAHAYFPVYGGDAHFDDSESWTIKSHRGTNLFQVAAHEFGHSLGLSHSDIKSALMAPFYRGYQSEFKLDSDDIRGIQALYGKKTAAKTPKTPQSPGTTPEPAIDEDAELCTDASIDAIFNSAEGVTYAFKGDHFWKLMDDGIAAGYPRLISRSWPGLPGSIDGAFTYKNGKTYFFKGSNYYRYTGKTKDDGYPKKISEGFEGIPNNIDAVMVWSGNGKIYFFKGSQFWRFDPTQRPPVKTTYPKPISNWEGIPNNINAALQYTNGYTYFFKGGQYWRFNDRMFKIDSADPPFPRPSGYWWFGCRSATSGNLGNSLKDHDLHDIDLQAQNSDVDDLILDAGSHQDPPKDAKHPSRGINERSPSSSASSMNPSLAIAILLVVFHCLRLW